MRFSILSKSPSLWYKLLVVRLDTKVTGSSLSGNVLTVSSFCVG